MMSPEDAMRIRDRVLTVLLAGALLGLAGCNRVGDDWKSAQAADTTEGYQQFLQQHQDSEFATKAQERIRQLSEDREWQAASGQDTPEGYQQFLAQHADSKWAQEARARLENFQAGGAAGAVPTADSPVAAATTGAGGAATSATAAATAPAPVEQAPVTAKASAKASAKAEPAGAEPAKAPPAARTPAPAKAPTRVASVAGTQYAQLGAFSSRERAEQEWKTLQSRFGAELGPLQPHYASGKNGSQAVYRLQVGVATSEQVTELCARLKKRSQDCIPVRS
jgi:cell division septation protein DedD